jgi:hypothetical protein
MPFFRNTTVSATGQNGSLSLDQVRKLIESSLLPGHFYEKIPGSLLWEHHRGEEIPWEIFHGQLLNADQTRLSESFESWNVYWHEDGHRSREPLISLKLDSQRKLIHITRAIERMVWQGYNAGDNVYLSREIPKWVPELVGTIRMDDFKDTAALEDELICMVFHAVIGTSRLPLTSVESPLTSFSFGQVAYFHRPASALGPADVPLRSPGELIAQGLHGHLNDLERAKLLETGLRTVKPRAIEEMAGLLATRWQSLGGTGGSMVACLRKLFNEVALSPYTGFARNTVDLLAALITSSLLTATDVIDFLGYVLRQTGRHLTAYDLVTFHHRGANYPDALLLDEVLRAYLDWIEETPESFVALDTEEPKFAKVKKIRRRALRQALFQWYLYRDLAVPDFPTSVGENARILPDPFHRLPEEQILVPARRTKRLFAGTDLNLNRPNVKQTVRQCFMDLQHAEELQELGTAIYLDRPLGLSKKPGEPDQTPLLSYELFSSSLVRQRLDFLKNHQFLGPTVKEVADLEGTMNACRALPGLPLQLDAGEQRPGVVSLEDAARIADDFVLLRTTRQSARRFLELFDFSTLANRCGLDLLSGNERVLIVRANVLEERSPEILVFFDENFRRRMEVQVDSSEGFRVRAGFELPIRPLRPLGIWTAAGPQNVIGERTEIGSQE